LEKPQKKGSHCQARQGRGRWGQGRKRRSQKRSRWGKKGKKKSNLRVGLSQGFFTLRKKPLTEEKKKNRRMQGGLVIPTEPVEGKEGKWEKYEIFNNQKKSESVQDRGEGPKNTQG